MPSSTQTSGTFLFAPWSDDFDFSQIDPALGIESISLSLTGYVYSMVSVDSSEAGEFESTATGAVTLRRPDGSAWLSVSPSASVVADLPGAGSEPALLAAGGTSSTSANYAAGQTASADAALLVGTGQVSLGVDASAQISASGPGNMTADFTTLVGATASLVAETGASAGGSFDWGDDASTTYLRPVIYPVIYMAGSVTTAPQVLTVEDAGTGADNTLTLNGFDPALGQLLSVNISIAANASGSVMAENLDPAADSLTVGQTATVYLYAPDGSSLASSSAQFDNTAQLAAFDGQADFSGPSSDTITESAPAGTVAATTTTVNGAGLADFETNGTVSLQVDRVGSTTIDGPGNLEISAALQAGAAVTASYTYLPGNVTYTDTTTGASGRVAGGDYSGPVAGLTYQYIWSSTDSVSLGATMPNVFLKGGDGNDTLTAEGGNNVLDGGAGSNLLVGGTGDDTFFVDARDSAATWSTLVNFHPGDQATIFGFQAGVSTMPLTASDGPAGNTGVTIHSETGGAGTGVDASITFGGISLATAQQSFVFTTGSVPGGSDYLLIQYR